MPKIFHTPESSLIFLFISLLFVNDLRAQVNPNTKRQCGSEFSFNQLMNSRDQAFADRYRKLDQFTRTYIQTLRQQRQGGRAGDRSSTIIIPVVVHVLYNNATENISNAQIQSQIDVINRDFRKLNSDVSLVPGAFSPLATDCLIEFRLAVRDPGCMPTTGITRTSTSVSSFSVPSDAESTTLAFNPIKSGALGGHDAWPRDKYLNIWVGDLTGGILGYSSFPTFPANVDGVVVDYEAFGTTGTASAPFHLGRTATHEIGHWLNLLHIWGDDGSACSGSDQVGDTPNQGGPNFGCPPFPHTSCSNGPNGDMSMNYMDYSGDACMYMFTIGQSERADATLYGERSSLLASDGLTPASELVGVTPDIFMKDRPEDTGIEPNPGTYAMYESQDIWVRNQDDGIVNQEHQDPLYRDPAMGLPNYIYVRVRNRSCTGTSASGVLKLYWSNAGSGLSFPDAWNGSITTPVLTGGMIGAGTPVTVPAGGFQIVKFPWFAPNPIDYSHDTHYAGQMRHFCLLARIETSTVAPYGMTFPETPANLWASVQNNNNIVWKNCTVVNEVPGGRLMTSLVVGNFSRNELITRLDFTSIWTARQENFLQYGKITVDLGADIYKKWVDGGRKSSGITRTGETTITIDNSNAWIDGIHFKAHEFYNIHVEFQFAKKIPFGDNRKLEFSVRQSVPDGQGRATPIGGETYQIKSLREDYNRATPSITLRIKAILQGAYQTSNGLMTDSLRARRFLPATTPYPALNFAAVNNPEPETIEEGVLDITGSQAITDWVWLELRDSIKNSSVLSTRSALIRRDGYIVDMDGVSPVSFPGLPDGNYYLALRHRNHLGIMSLAPMAMRIDDEIMIDFTNPATAAYGTNARRNVNGVMALWAGDPNRDGIIKYNGASNDKVMVLSRVGLATPNNLLLMYDSGDLNLDGTVKYNGSLNDKNVILSNVGLASPSNIILEQLAK